MPFCEHCGARLAQGASACGSCGRHANTGAPRSAPPPPPPGYEPQASPAWAARPAPAPAVRQPGSAAPAPVAVIPTRGLPAVAVPPLAAAIALIVTTIYAAAYELIEWGEIGAVDWFLTGAATTVLRSPLLGYGSVDEWLSYAPFGGGWVIAIPFIALMFATMLLASLTRTDTGQRLAIGGLVFAPTILFTVLLTLLNYAVVGADYFGGLGEALAKGAAGAAIVGLSGGLLGALLSLAIRPPTRSSRLG